MSNLVFHRVPGPDVHAIALPEPRVPGVTIRPAVTSDLDFIDALQKKHSKMVGFLHLETLENKIKAGHVLIAEERKSKVSNVQNPNAPVGDEPFGLCDFGRLDFEPVGYCIFQDKYDKHEDCGIFYQVNVVPGKQRGLIGAALVKAQLDRAAYGCKLACCWCAQDLEANCFWESLGFVPLAFRTGSRRVRGRDGKMGPRIHIFWQRRVREGDDETPFWFPSETHGGAVGESRIVLPIPPHTHWSDAKPALLPGVPGFGGVDEALKSLPSAQAEKKPRKAKVASSALVPVRPPSRPPRGVWVAPPKPPPPTKEQIAAAKKAARAERKPPKSKNDPKLVAAARELRDRYIEQINAGRMLPPSASGKYDVSRQLEASPTFRGAMKIESLPSAPMLEAA